MLHHASVSVKDWAKSKDFYAKALAPLGYTVGMELAEYQVVGFKNREGALDFWIGQHADASGTHIAFMAQSAEAVQAFHAAALAAGGTDNGAPGYRPQYSPGYYAAFVYDFDGSNIEAVWHDPSKL